MMLFFFIKIFLKKRDSRYGRDSLLRQHGICRSGLVQLLRRSMSVRHVWYSKVSKLLLSFLQLETVRCLLFQL